MEIEPSSGMGSYRAFRPGFGVSSLLLRADMPSVGIMSTKHRRLDRRASERSPSWPHEPPRHSPGDDQRAAPVESEPGEQQLSAIFRKSSEVMPRPRPTAS